jgi:hypothetical protein
MMVWARCLNLFLKEKPKSNGANIIFVDKNIKCDVDGAHNAFENKNIECKGDHMNKAFVDIKT